MNINTYFNRVEAFTRRFESQSHIGFIARDEPATIDWINRDPDALIGDFAVFNAIPREVLKRKFPDADGL